MEALFWRAAGPLIADDDPSAVLLAGMMVCAADGMLVNVADTPANRAMFGCTGTAAQDGTGAAPFPQLRVVALTARAGRAMLGAIPAGPGPGSRRCSPAWCAAARTCSPAASSASTATSPGYDLITAILDAGGHVVARVKAGISLPMRPKAAAGCPTDPA